jgi:hypothetical protein
MQKMVGWEMHYNRWMPTLSVCSLATFCDNFRNIVVLLFAT